MKMSLFIFFIFIMFIMTLSAYMHERDIVKSCESKGESTYASWYKDIKCEIINEKDK